MNKTKKCKAVDLVDGGFVINGAYPVYFINECVVVL